LAVKLGIWGPCMLLQSLLSKSRSLNPVLVILVFFGNLQCTIQAWFAWTAVAVPAHMQRVTDFKTVSEDSYHMGFLLKVSLIKLFYHENDEKCPWKVKNWFSLNDSFMVI